MGSQFNVSRRLGGLIIADVLEKLYVGAERGLDMASGTIYKHSLAKLDISYTILIAANSLRRDWASFSKSAG